MEVVLAIIIIIISLYVLYKIFVYLKKKGFFKKENKVKQKKEKKQKNKDISKIMGSVTLVDKYMYRREVKTLIALNRVLPTNFIALPKVGVANFLEPMGSRNLYNEVKDYFVDFVIFEEETMKPRLVIDVYDNSFEDELLKHRHPLLMEVLSDLKINVLEIAVRGEVDLEILKDLLIKNLGIVEEKVD